jgi:predicted DNA-binding transcriptional regulator YafY
MRHEKATLLLDLARRLAASAEGLTLDEMAQALSVSRRTVERMRDAAWTLFPQMEEIADGAAKRFRIPGGLDGFYQSPEAEELLELGKAAAQLRAAGAERRAQTLEGLERKVRAAMRGSALRRMAPDIEAMARAETHIAVHAGPRPFEDAAMIGAVRQALTAMRQVSFVYRGGSRPGERRVMTPYGLMFGRANYLVAAPQGSTAPRNLRLDRIRELEVLDAPGAPPPDFDLDAYANRSFGIYQDEVIDVVLRVLPAGAAEAMAWRFHPTQTVEPQADGAVIVRFSASGALELAWHLFTWGDKIEVLAPDSLRATLIETLQIALSRHRATDALQARPASSLG